MLLGAIGLQTQIWNNNLKSILLLMGFPFLLLLMTWAFFVGLAIADPTGASNLLGYSVSNPFKAGFVGLGYYWSIPFAVAGIWFLFAWMFHQRIIELATGARHVERKEAPQLYNLVENLCISRGLTMPRLCIMETEALNAFASGISNKSYTVTVTRGLLNMLNEKELEAVLAHEISHIRNRDVRLLIVSVIFVGMLSFFCEIIFRSLRGNMRGNSRGKGKGAAMLVALAVFIIGYMLSIVIRFALSRRREFLADAGSVELTKNPDALISALKKISSHAAMPDISSEVRQMFIDNPPAPEAFSLFATHPPMEERIAALVMMGGRDTAAEEAPAKKQGPWG